MVGSEMVGWLTDWLSLANSVEYIDRRHVSACPSVPKSVPFSGGQWGEDLNPRHLRVYRRSMVGSEMVGWLVECFPSLVRSRAQSVGVWQALLEEGVLVHGSVCLRSICQIAINSSKSL